MDKRKLTDKFIEELGLQIPKGRTYIKNKNAHYTYFWYDHCFLRGSEIIKLLEKAIREHDWATFCLFYKVLNNFQKYTEKDGISIYNKDYIGKPIIYLPDTIYVSEKGKDGYTLELNEKTFKFIDSSSYECG